MPNPIIDAPIRATRRARLRLVARFSAGFCLLLAIALPLAAAAIWLDPQILLDAFGRGGPAPGPQMRLLGGLCTFALSLPLAMALLRLRAAFRLMAADQGVSAQAARTLRAAALWLMGAILSGVAAQAVASVAMTWERGPGQRELALAVSSNGLLSLLFAALLLAMSWVMAEAAELAEDNRSII